MSQYQLSLALMTTLSLVIAFSMVLSPLFSLPPHSSQIVPPWVNLHPTLKWIAVGASLFLSIHLLSLAWKRTIRKFINFSLIAWLNLSAIYLPLKTIDLISTQHYQNETEVGKPNFFATSSNTHELNLFVDFPEQERIGIYTIPFNDLSPNKTYSHKNWDFEILIEETIHHASVGGPQARLKSNSSRVTKRLQAENGIAAQNDLRIFSMNRKEAGGVGSKINVSYGDKKSSESYLIFSAKDSTITFPAQQIEGSDAGYSIALLPRRMYPGFAWTVTHRNTLQEIHFQHPNTLEPIKSNVIGKSQASRFKNYLFRIQPMEPAGFNPNNILLTIEARRFPLLIPILEKLWLVLAFLTFAFRLQGFKNPQNRNMEEPC